MPGNERHVRRERASRFAEGSASELTPAESRRRVILPGDLSAPRKQFAWRSIARSAGFVVGTLALIWVILFSHWLDVRSVTLTGSDTVSQDQLRKTVDSYFKERSLQRNIFFTDTDQLGQALRTAYPTFIKVNINRTIFLGLQVRVAEIAPALIWKTGSENWVIGTDGRILRKLKSETNIAGSVTDTAQLSVEAGKQVANPGFVSFVVATYKQAGKYQLGVKDVTIGNTTQEATLMLDNGILVKVDTTRDAATELEAARKTFDTANADRKPVSQYIDVRVPGRAFYK